MTTRKNLHDLVDWLPECAWDDAHHSLLHLMKNRDPVAYALYNAPEDDEPLSDEDRAAIDKALEDRNPENWLSHEEVKNRLIGP